METQRLTVPAEAAGQRLDAWLAEQVDALSRSAAQRLIVQGAVLLDGAAAPKNAKLAGGETVLLTVPDPVEARPAPQDIPLDIVYEDADIIVINKPQGMVVHPAPGSPDGTLVNALLAHCGDSISGINGELRPGIVHRIDKETSGLLVAAKNDRAHKSLAAQIAAHTARRTYEAIVLGRLREASGEISAPIGRSIKDRKKMAVIPSGRAAVTHYETLCEYTGYTHVRIMLETGRTHQIRVHFAHLGHPVAGDPVYGAKNDKSGLKAQCLHAAELSLCHPVSGEEMRFTAEKPQVFLDFLQKLQRIG